MGNRSKYVAVMATAGAALVAARRRARLRTAGKGIGQTILPSAATEPAFASEPGVEEGHAPGHRHLPPVDAKRPAKLPRPPWTLHGHKTRHPYAMD